MVSNRSKRPRLELGLGLPIGPFGTCATLCQNLYTLPHEVVRRLHMCTCKGRLQDQYSVVYGSTGSIAYEVIYYYLLY